MSDIHVCLHGSVARILSVVSSHASYSTFDPVVNLALSRLLDAPVTQNNKQKKFLRPIHYCFPFNLVGFSRHMCFSIEMGQVIFQSNIN